MCKVYVILIISLCKYNNNILNAIEAAYGASEEIYLVITLEFTNLVNLEILGYGPAVCIVLLDWAYTIRARTERFTFNTYTYSSGLIFISTYG